MTEPLTAAAIGGLLVKSLKEVGKWIWGYAKKTLWSMWENKYILIIAGLCSGLFFSCYNMLNSWFGFPPLLNWAIIGIFALINFSWVISYWKSPPSDNGGNSQGPNVSTGN